MNLNILWFILIAVLYTGFFLLEGFDYGVGILLPFVGKTDAERRTLINTIGPFWDGNEVWLLTAGGATFAAFPNWYATMFSGFYLPLFLILLALIVRGVAFEFRSKHDDPSWRNLWDWCIFVGSLVPALLFGVAFANILKGVPIDAEMNYVGGFFNLLNPYALVGGLATLSLFTLHGATFLSLRTTGKLREKVNGLIGKLWITALVIVVLEVILTYTLPHVRAKAGVVPGPVPIVAALALLAAGPLAKKGKDGWAFVMSAVAVVFVSITIFQLLYPNVMVSSLNPEWSLTIYNASSSPYTLKVMTIVAAIFTPIVLVYQAWTYYIFGKRVTAEPEKLVY
ncbi:MAG: cytochrome d ubiquinol oxidase subunit II [Calditrichaeota bacterium]|nr:cytochrome d ubiquinol oxidase subunit II [Calditrichota bacterium]